MRSTVLLRVSIVLTVAILSLAMTGIASAGKPVKPTAPTYEAGDILFMSDPTDPWTSLTYWTHNAIYVGGGKVVEAVSGGVRYWDVSRWCLDHPRLVMRLHPEDTNGVTQRSARIEFAVNYAKNQIGKPYDFRFNKFDESRQYCSELIWHAFFNYDSTPKMDLDSNGGDMVTPDNERNSAYLKYVAEYPARQR